MGYCDVSADEDVLKKGLDKTVSRGPDAMKIIDTGSGLLGFQRLSIMGLTEAGMQPFELDGNYILNDSRQQLCTVHSNRGFYSCLVLYSFPFHHISKHKYPLYSFNSVCYQSYPVMK